MHPILLLGPLLAPHPGGLGFFGPTDAQVPAIWWNAAALGELSGTHLHLSGSPLFFSEQMTRSGMSTVNASDLQPDVFFGATTDFTTEHIRVGFGYHVPFRDSGTLPDNSPLRYQRISTDIQNQFFSPAAAFHINSTISFGIGMNIIWSHAHLRLARFRPLDCGSGIGTIDCPGLAMAGSLENPAYDETLDIDGSALSVGAQAGFLWNILGRVTLGGAFISRAAGIGRSTIPADRYGATDGNNNPVRNVSITIPRAGRTTPPAFGTCLPNDPTHACVYGFGELDYALPDLVHFGARWLVTDRLEAAATFRYANWGQRTHDMRIHMTSNDLRAAQEPELIVLYRGYSDDYGVSVRGAYCARPIPAAGERCPLRLGLMAGIDTGMYNQQAVQADALDGPTIELGVLFEWQLNRHFRLMGGGSWSGMVTRQVTNSVYDANTALACADSGGDAGVCARVNAGQGIPSANGTYALQSYTASLALAVDFWGR
jgi:long-subunit fatty acid transport protein